MNTTGKFQVESTFPDAVIELDQKHFPHPWTMEQWKGLSPAQNHLFTWTLGNKLVGYALFQYLTGDDTAHLLKILIDPDRQGSGESQRFWSAIKAHLKSADLESIYLEVEASNARAIGFYGKCGLTVIRRNKAYYSNGDDALIMTMTL